MSPTSLANRFSQKRDRLRPIPAHRRFIAIVTRLPKRARAVLALALILLVWRVAEPTTTKLKGRSRPRSAAVKPSRAVRFVSPHLDYSPKVQVHYEDGSVQRINFSGSSGGAGKAQYDLLWGSGHVEAIEVETGIEIKLIDRDGKETSVESSVSPVCQQIKCQNIKGVRANLSLEGGLRQLRMSDAGKPLTIRIPSNGKAKRESITLVTQFTLSRISRFERLLDNWDGPVSAAIYLTEADDIDLLEAHLANPDRSAKWHDVALTIIKPDYSITESALLSRLRYPINRLRNLALDLAPSPYVLVVDVDFVPSPDMHSLLSARAIPLLTRPSTRNSHSPTLKRTAVVIPTFALTSAFNGIYPKSLSDLANLVTSDPPLATLTDVNAGHGPTSPSLLFAHLSYPALPQNSTSTEIDPSHSYEICFEPQYEPYYVLAKSSHPLYDERFTDQGGDKQAHALLLNALGYSFHVMRDVWVLHPPKTNKEEEEWPAARLISHDGKSEREGGGSEEGGGEHFNLAAQRDETRFRYFQDFLPEMEKILGRNVRWPRGCSARIAGGRRFGKTSADSIAFGL